MSNSTEKDLETFFPTPKKIKVGGKELEIKPFVINTRTKAVKILSDIVTDVLDQGVDVQDTTKLGYQVIQNAGEKMVDLYKILFPDEEEAWLKDNLTMRDELLILKTIIEVNNIPLLVSQVKQMVTVATPKPSESEK